MTAIEFRTFSVGDVLGRSFTIWSKNFAPFWICLILLLPSQLLGIYVEATLSTPNHGAGLGALAIFLGFIFLSGLLSVIATCAIVYGALQQMAGHHAGVGECLGRALSLLFPLLGVAIVASIAISLGLVALIVPGVLLAVMWWTVIPVMVVEQPGVFAALGRSAELTKGHRWSILGLLVLIAIIVFALAFVIQVAGALIGSPEVPQYLQWLISAVSSILFATASAVGYHDLRVEKEGVDAGQLAAVFD